MNWEITPISTATAVGLFLATGFCSSASVVALSAMPALIIPPVKGSQNSKNTGHSPSHLARQWKATYDNGKVYGPVIIAISAAAWLYVASILPSGQAGARNLYIAGALICFSTIPYTGLVMLSTIHELCDRALAAESGQKLEEEKEKPSASATPTAELIRYWAQLHTVRALIPLAGIACVVMANL